MRSKLLLLSVLMIPSACKSDGCGSEFAATSFVRSAVTEALSSPDSASFTNVQAHPDGECTFIVAGRVSAQNGFGAEVQNTFSAMIEFQQGSNDYRVYDLLITE